jgi:hypothetical protein
MVLYRLAMGCWNFAALTHARTHTSTPYTSITYDWYREVTSRLPDFNPLDFCLWRTRIVSSCSQRRDTSAAQHSQYGGEIYTICEEKLIVPTKWLLQVEIQRIEIGWAWGPRTYPSVMIGIEIVCNFEDNFVMSNYKMVLVMKLIFFAILGKEYYKCIEWKTHHIFSNHGLESMD